MSDPESQSGFITCKLRKIVIGSVIFLSNAVPGIRFKKIRRCLFVESEQWCKGNPVIYFNGQFNSIGVRIDSKIIVIETVRQSHYNTFTDERVELQSYWEF